MKKNLNHKQSEKQLWLKTKPKQTKKTQLINKSLEVFVSCHNKLQGSLSASAMQDTMHQQFSTLHMPKSNG